MNEAAISSEFPGANKISGRIAPIHRQYPARLIDVQPRTRTVPQPTCFLSFAVFYDCLASSFGLFNIYLLGFILIYKVFMLWDLWFLCNSGNASCERQDLTYIIRVTFGRVYKVSRSSATCKRATWTKVDRMQSPVSLFTHLLSSSVGSCIPVYHDLHRLAWISMFWFPIACIEQWWLLPGVHLNCRRDDWAGIPSGWSQRALVARVPSLISKHW